MNYSHTTRNIVNTLGGSGGGGLTIPSIVTDGSAPIYMLDGVPIYRKKYIIDELPTNNSKQVSTDLLRDNVRVVGISGVMQYKGADGEHFPNNTLPLPYPNPTSGEVRMFANETDGNQYVEIVIATNSDRSTRKAIIYIDYYLI